MAHSDLTVLVALDRNICPEESIPTPSSAFVVAKSIKRYLVQAHSKSRLAPNRVIEYEPFSYLLHRSLVRGSLYEFP